MEVRVDAVANDEALLGLGAEDEGHRQRAIGAAFIMLDMVIGELDAMTKIGFMEFRKLPQNPRGQGLRPIGELPAIVDSLP